MNGAPLDHLAAVEAYVRIVELGSFTAAARDLGLRQATVSRRIAALEDALGVQLLVRTTRAVGVTEAGERFYEHARDWLGDWSAAVARARGEHAGITGRLRISLPVVFGQRFITPAVPALLRQHPQLRLELLFSDRYVDLVSEGIDVAVRVGRPIDTGYRARILGVTPRRLVASPTYLARHGAPPDPRALARHRCLLHSGLDTHETWVFHTGDGALRVDVRGQLSANHSEALLAAALAGEGIALLASWLVDAEIARGQLVHLLPDAAPPEAPIQALFASARHPPAAVGAFLDFLSDAILAALPEGPDRSPLR